MLQDMSNSYFMFSPD